MAIETATVTSKGQITVPVRMREKLGLKPGSKIRFEEQADGSFVVRRKTGDIRKLKGFFEKPAKAMTIEEMDEAIGREVAGRDAGSRY